MCPFHFTSKEQASKVAQIAATTATEKQIPEVREINDVLSRLSLSFHYFARNFIFIVCQGGVW